MAFISPPPRMPLLFRLAVWFARRITGKDLLPVRLLAWYPRAAVSSALLEGLITHHEGRLDARMLKLVRMAVSFSAGCPFCMDMNSSGWQLMITPAELAALQGTSSLEFVPTFRPDERLAIAYARLITASPLAFPAGFIQQLRAAFSEREIVILASTAAQVNYWARLIQALGCPPAGFNERSLPFLAVGPGLEGDKSQ